MVREYYARLLRHRATLTLRVRTPHPLQLRSHQISTCCLCDVLVRCACAVLLLKATTTLQTGSPLLTVRGKGFDAYYSAQAVSPGRGGGDVVHLHLLPRF